MDSDNMSSSQTGDAGSAAGLGRLNELDEFKIAEGFPDIRGWDVKTTDGQKIGKVGDLIVDTGAMRVRYLDVEVDRSIVQKADGMEPDDDDQHTLLPIGNVQLDEKNDDVLVDGYSIAQLAGMPRYSGQQITPEYEQSWRNSRMRGDASAAQANSYDDESYDDQRLYEKRRAAGNPRNITSADSEVQRLTLAEEQLVVGKRQTSAGEVELRKTVETEHVQESVSVTHEEVTVERRPLSANSRVEAPSIGEDEIRMTIMEEQLVVEKRLVPREEIIVRKKQVTNQETVGADLQRERLVTEGLDQTRNTTGLDQSLDTTANRNRNS